MKIRCMYYIAKVAMALNPVISTYLKIVQGCMKPRRSCELVGVVYIKQF